MAKARLNLPVQVRLAAHARLLLRVAAVMARLWLPLPHAMIVAVTNRSWRMRIGEGRWQSIRIDSAGRIVR